MSYIATIEVVIYADNEQEAIKKGNNLAQTIRNIKDNKAMLTQLKVKDL